MTIPWPKTAVITWRLAHEGEGKYVRFILIDHCLFRLMGTEDSYFAPIGNAYVSPGDAHLDAVAETHQLELEGFEMAVGDVRYTEYPASVDQLRSWVWNDPDKARAELLAIVLNAFMVGEVLA